MKDSLPTPRCLNSIHRAKTGALLRASVRMGAIYAGAQRPSELAALSSYGEHIGLAFQIVDDILDVEESSEALGKTAGKDAAAAEDHVPRCLRLGRIEAHGGSGAPECACGARAVRRAGAVACARWPTASSIERRDESPSGRDAGRTRSRRIERESAGARAGG